MTKDDDKKKVEEQKPKTEIKKKTPTKAKKVATKKPVKKTETKAKPAVKKQTPAKKKPATKKKTTAKPKETKPQKEEKPKKEEKKEEEAEIVEEVEEEKYKVKKKPTLEKEQQKKLAIRKQIKKRTPDFLREEWFRYKRIPKNWRRPDGISSKMRINLKYRPSKVRVGFRGPKDVRGLHSSGFEEIIIFNVNELEQINPKTQAARIGGSVGTKKRIEIEKKADELEVRILNR
jgi:large subunit ribosomal protein L32e